MVFVPVLDGPNSRRYKNESSAAMNLSAVIALQRKYAVAHPEKGFACELPLLKSSEHQESGDYEPLLLVTGAQAGYKFSLGGCYADAKGTVVHYQVTAVPIELGKTGLAAFCGDDSGLLWYDREGSATNCLTSRRALK
jgi:type IV pilus assembly protein PilA